MCNEPPRGLLTQFKLCYGADSQALTLMRRDAPRRYSPPWGGREGMDQHGELAVVEQVKRAEQLTADRDRSYFCRCNTDTGIISVALLGFKAGKGWTRVTAR